MPNLEQDLKVWRKFQELINGPYKYSVDEFFQEYSNKISDLFREYAKTKSGSSMNPNIGIRQKFSILSKVMDDIERAESEKNIKNTIDWENRQLEEESLETRLEREREAKETYYSIIKLSKRDK